MIKVFTSVWHFCINQQFFYSDGVSDSLVCVTHCAPYKKKAEAEDLLSADSISRKTFRLKLRRCFMSRLDCNRRWCLHFVTRQKLNGRLSQNVRLFCCRDRGKISNKKMQEKLDKVLLICSFLGWEEKIFGHF